MDKKEESRTGWIARDEYCNTKFQTPGTLCFYYQKPERVYSDKLGGFWFNDALCVELPRDVFPELTWENEPVYVKLTIEVLQ